MITLSYQQVQGINTLRAVTFKNKRNLLQITSHFITVTYSINLHHFIAISVLGN